MRALCAVVFVSCLVGAAATGGDVHAENEPNSESESLVQQGIQFRRQRNDSAALTTFRQAHAMNPTPRTLAQIALAEQALGKWVDAERDLIEALTRTDDTWIRNNVPLLQQALDSIRQRLASLVVTSNGPGAELWIDGVRIQSPPASATRVVAGSLLIEVRAKGYETVRRAVVIPPGSNWREEVRLVPVTSAANAPPSPSPAVDHPTEPRSSGNGATQRVIGLGLGGMGVAALATGATFGLLASRAKTDYLQHCGANIGAPDGYCDGEGVRRQADAVEHAALSTWFLLGGGVATVVGTTLVLTSPRPAAATQVSFGVGWVGVSGAF